MYSLYCTSKETIGACPLLALYLVPVVAGDDSFRRRCSTLPAPPACVDVWSVHIARVIVGPAVYGGTLICSPWGHSAAKRPHRAGAPHCSIVRSHNRSLPKNVMAHSAGKIALPCRPLLKRSRFILGLRLCTLLGVVKFYYQMSVDVYRSYSAGGSVISVRSCHPRSSALMAIFTAGTQSCWRRLRLLCWIYAVRSFYLLVQQAACSHANHAGCRAAASAVAAYCLVARAAAARSPLCMDAATLWDAHLHDHRERHCKADENTHGDIWEQGERYCRWRLTR